MVREEESVVREKSVGRGGECGEGRRRVVRGGECGERRRVW